MSPAPSSETEVVGEIADGVVVVPATPADEVKAAMRASSSSKLSDASAGSLVYP